MQEDITLAQLKRGDHQTFSRLFNLYHRDLVLYAGRYLPDLETCEDIVQDVFLKIWHIRDRLEISVPLRVYLISAVRNSCLNEIKRRRIIYDTTIDSLTWMPERVEEEDVLYSELREQFQQALQQLPALYRQAFEMNRFQNKKYQEIADMLGVSKRTIEVRIGKALAFLRNHLKEYLPMILFLFTK